MRVLVNKLRARAREIGAVGAVLYIVSLHVIIPDDFTEDRFTLFEKENFLLSYIYTCVLYKIQINNQSTKFLHIPELRSESRKYYACTLLLLLLLQQCALLLEREPIKRAALALFLPASRSRAAKEEKDIKIRRGHQPPPLPP